MGKRGIKGKVQSIKFPRWMSEAIQKMADDQGQTFTYIVLDLLRQELAAMNITMGIGRESVQEQEKPAKKKAS